MTVLELQERLEKAEIKHAKLIKKLEKLSNKLTRKHVLKHLEELAKANASYKESSAYLCSPTNVTFSNQEDESKYDYQDFFSLIRWDIQEALNLINNYKLKLEKAQNRANQTKITVVVEFLAKWREQAFKWYIATKDNYLKEYDALTNNKSTDKEYYLTLKNLINGYSSLLRLFDHYECRSTSTFVEKLNKLLDKEVEDKYFDLVERVTVYTGEITSAEYLRIAPTGELDGIIVGEKGKAKVETISAGGYNIQCFHYRVLVREIK